MTNIPTIQSVGPPPERHAARVVAEMAHWLHGERERLWMEMRMTIRGSRSRWGNPVAQQRLTDRMRKSGGKALLDIQCKTGKRGKFTLTFSDWHVYDPINHLSVEEDYQFPEKPWLECVMNVLPFDPRNPDIEPDSVRLFVVTHHAMQRLAERCDARTPFDLVAAMKELYDTLNFRIKSHKVGSPEDITASALAAKSALRSLRAPVAGGEAVIEFDKSRSTLVVLTVLSAAMTAQ